MDQWSGLYMLIIALAVMDLLAGGFCVYLYWRDKYRMLEGDMHRRQNYTREHLLQVFEPALYKTLRDFKKGRVQGGSTLHSLGYQGSSVDPANLIFNALLENGVAEDSADCAKLKRIIKKLAGKFDLKCHIPRDLSVDPTILFQ